MATTKTAVKKTATKKTASKKITLADDTLYVLSVRTKLFFWKPHSIYETRSAANAALLQLEFGNVLSVSYAKVDSAKLIR
jgi:hypothetical protein